MQRRKLNFSLLLAAAGVAAFALSGCGSSGQSAESSASGAGSQTGAPADGATTANDSNAQNSGVEGEAVLSYGDKKYSVQLEFCSLYDTGDALFHGLALDDSGNEVGFLEGDFNGLTDAPHGEVRLDVGATAKMQSMDTFIAMGNAGAEIVVTDFSVDSLILMGGVWDENGTVLSTGTLKVTC